MEPVRFGKKWKIKTPADLQQAFDTLKENEFVANMSDDYSCTRMELAEIERQRADIVRQAKETGVF